MTAPVDLFQLLGITPKFGVAAAELERRQRELTIERKADGPLALEAINLAVRMLKDPVSRAEQLFQIKGWSVNGPSEPSLLERIFAEREQVDAARRTGDIEALHGWLGDVALPRQRQLMAELERVLDQPPTVDAPTHARQLLEQLRYDSRAIQAARLVIEALEQ